MRYISAIDVKLAGIRNVVNKMGVYLAVNFDGQFEGSRNDSDCMLQLP